MQADRQTRDPALDDESDGSDGSDEPGGSEPLDAPNAPRRRRHSRPRLRRVKVGKSSPGTTEASKARVSRAEQAVQAEQAEQAVQAVRRVATEVARQVRGHDHDNLDLDCRVAGVTHRGGFKLRVVRLEEMTSVMVDRWRALCLSRGYASAISFDVTASEALIVATPFLKTTSWASWCTSWCTSWCGNACVKTDPLNALFVGALALNTLRHALDHFA